MDADRDNKPDQRTPGRLAKLVSDRIRLLCKKCKQLIEGGMDKVITEIFKPTTPEGWAAYEQERAKFEAELAANKAKNQGADILSN